MQNKDKKKEQPASYCKPLALVAIVLAILLIVLVVMNVYESRGRGGMIGGRRKFRGGDCGCAATPAP